MTANVALTDTFDQWRVKTNEIVVMTQTDGMSNIIKTIDTTNSTSNTTGSIITTGGVGIAKSVVIGENLKVHGNTVIDGDTTISGNLVFGSADTDQVSFSADINSNMIPNANLTFNLGNTSLYWANTWTGHLTAEQKTDSTKPALTVNSLDVDVIGVDINASQTTANVLDITADAVTTGTVINVTADLLTDGSALAIDSDSPETDTRNVVSIINNNALSVAATALYVKQDSTNTVARFVGQSTVVIPAGTSAQRGHALQGGIRYNTTLSAFEGYSGSTWGSLGGLIDVDQDTYVLAETSAGADNDSLDFFAASVQRMKIDQAGVFTIGPSFTTKETITGAVPTIQLEAMSTDASTSIWRNSADNAGPTLILGKSRGTAVNADTIVADNDVIGSILFSAADGVDRASVAACIQALIGGTPGADDTPGELLFKTTADGAQAPTEKMRILANGRIGIGTNNPLSNLTVTTQENVDNADNRGIAHYQWSTGATYGGTLNLGHANHNTSGNHSAVDTDDVLGQIYFMGTAGDIGNNPFWTGAAIKAIAAETWVESSNNVTESGSYLSFYTTDIGTPTLDERMRITDAGFVGIGTALNPSVRLHVKEDATTFSAMIEQANGQGNVLDLFASASDDDTNDLLKIRTDAATLMVVENNGKVGIGTAAPATFLHINAANAGIRVEEDTDNDYIQLDMVQGGRARLRTSDARVLTIQEDGGNVGIGHSGADEMLHLQSNVTTKPVLQLEQATDDATSAELKFVNGQGGGAASAAGHDLGRITFTGNMSNGSALQYAEIYSEITDPHVTTGKDGKIGLKINCLDTMTELLTLLPSGSDGVGYVGIGKTSPTSELAVEGAGTGWRGQFMIIDTTTGNNADPYMTFWSGSETGSGATGLMGHVGFVGSDGVMAINNYTGGALALQNAGNGVNVGIGTNTPQANLDVSAAAPIVRISSYSTTNSVTPSLNFFKSDHATIGTYNATTDTDCLGTINFNGTDSTNTPESGSAISCFQTGAAGTAGIPTDLRFATSILNTPRVERMRIHSNGNISVGVVTPVSFTPSLEIRGTNPALCLSVDSTHFYNMIVDGGNNVVTIIWDDSADMVWKTAVNNGGTSPTERMKLTSAGVFTVNGAGVGGVSDWTVTSTNFLPNSGSSQDIGSSSAKVDNLYTVNLYLGDANLDNTDRTLGNEVDGTKGSWTIQEGDENLFVLNRVNGKKYKMSLIEA